MKCMRCQDRESVVQVHQIVNDQSVVVHLCQGCAAEQGIETDVGLESNPLGGFLAALERGTPEPGTEACPSCGATLQDFRQTSRLGCPACYTTFQDPLRSLLRRLHGATIHTGRRHLTPGDAETDTRALARDLRSQLAAAVDAENFERAAELRDRLRELE